jgi:opacity protein-like surface antigen
MRNLFLIACLALLLPVFALAQDAPKVEVFGGYSYFRADEEDNPETDFHGFEISGNFNLNKWLGVKGDFSSHYADFQISPGVKANVSLQMYLAGLQFTSYKNDKVTPYVHALIGVARANTSVPQAFAGTGPRRISENAFALVLGGGLDVNIKKSLAWRAFQSDYVFTTFDDFRDDRQHSLRLSTGLVWKIGEH